MILVWVCNLYFWVALCFGKGMNKAAKKRKFMRIISFYGYYYFNISFWLKHLSLWIISKQLNVTERDQTQLCAIQCNSMYLNTTQSVSKELNKIHLYETQQDSTRLNQTQRDFTFELLLSNIVLRVFLPNLLKVEWIRQRMCYSLAFFRTQFDSRCWFP